MRQQTLEEQLEAIRNSLAKLDTESESGPALVHLRVLLQKRAEELERKIKSGG